MHELQRKIIIVAAFMGALAVVLGAFGAHSLADYLSPKQLSTYQTGIDYHFFHSLALLGIANLPLSTDQHQRYLKFTYRLLVLGIIFFSGSLYLLACKAILPITGFIFVIGPMTPIGGLFFILAWACLIAYAFCPTPQKKTS